MLRKNFKIFQVSTFCTTWRVLNCAELRQKTTKTVLELWALLQYGFPFTFYLIFIELVLCFAFRIILCLGVPKFAVFAVGVFKEIFVRAVLNQLTVIEHEDSVTETAG